MNKSSIGQIITVMVAFFAMDTITAGADEPPGHNPMTLMDRDKNGAVSLQELRDHQPETTDEQFRRWDVDDSGELEQEELMSAIREILARQAATNDR